MKKPKAQQSQPYHCKSKHPIEQIFEMRHDFWQELPNVKKAFEEDICCIGEFFKGAKEHACSEGLTHDYWMGQGQRFAHAYYRLFFSNHELFPNQKNHPSDFDAWTTYEALTNPDFDPNINQGMLELLNLRSSLELFKYKGHSINFYVQEAEEQGKYDQLEAAMSHMVKDYYEKHKQK